MSKDQFNTLFKYLQKEFSMIEKKLNNTAGRVDGLTEIVNAHSKKADGYMKQITSKVA